MSRFQRAGHRYGRAIKTATLLGALLLATGGTSGCTKKGDSVVLAGDGSRLNSEQIDRDPLGLLPSGPVALFQVDVRAAVRSNLGSSISKLFRRLLPLGQQANFDPQRDVERIVGGVYTFQGVDSAVVIQGTFDPAAIRSAAQSGQPNALGAKLTRLEYAGNDLFVAGDVGFVVVTKHTVVAGNETGIRRVLDRIRDKHIQRDVPDWMAKPIDHPQASMVAVADLQGEVSVHAAARQFPFLHDLSVVRVLGNFQPPGINLAGTLTYPNETEARAAGASLKDMGRLASYTALLSVLGIRPPIEKLQVETKQKNVQFVASIDAQGLTQVLDWFLGSR